MGLVGRVLLVGCSLCLYLSRRPPPLVEREWEWSVMGPRRQLLGDAPSGHTNGRTGLRSLYPAASPYVALPFNLSTLSRIRANSSNCGKAKLGVRGITSNLAVARTGSEWLTKVHLSYDRVHTFGDTICALGWLSLRWRMVCNGHARAREEEGERGVR